MSKPQAKDIVSKMLSDYMRNYLRRRGFLDDNAIIPEPVLKKAKAYAMRHCYSDITRVSTKTRKLRRDHARK